MLSCFRCGVSFDESETRCPACGAPASADQIEQTPARRCGPGALFFLKFAWAVAFLGGIFAAVFGLIAFAEGQHLNGILWLFVGSPVSFGHYVALGLIIGYAERRG